MHPATLAVLLAAGLQILPDLSKRVGPFWTWVAAAVAAAAYIAASLAAARWATVGGLRAGDRVRAFEDIRAGGGRSGKVAVRAGDFGTVEKVLSRTGQVYVRWDSRRDARDGAALPSAAGQLRKVPRLLRAQGVPALDGVYALCSELGLSNGQSVWRRDGARPLWLYSTPRGRWCITADLAGMRTGRGVAFSCGAHGGNSAAAASSGDWHFGKEMCQLEWSEASSAAGAEADCSAQLPDPLTETALFSAASRGAGGAAGGRAAGGDTSGVFDTRPEVLFPCGTHVITQGLENRVLNGTRGRVLSHREGGRVEVQLSGRLNPVGIAPSCLRRAPWRKGHKHYEGRLTGDWGNPDLKSWVEELSSDDGGEGAAR